MIVTLYIFVNMNMAYNTFMETNENESPAIEQIANIFQSLGSPARVAILIAIGKGEACVCHLEAILGWRQAYISQNLMALRKAEILQDRRDGRFIYYRLTDTGILALLKEAASLSGMDAASVDALLVPSASPGCECPRCVPAAVPAANLR
jgi:ArsR family transcriptional regulator